MLRSELIEKLSARFPHLTQNTVDLAVRIILDHMAETIVSGQRIEIRRFVSFYRHERKARMARNPKTGNSVAIAATAVARFRAGAPLRQIVNSSSV